MGFGAPYDNPEDAAAGASQLLERQPDASKYEYGTVIYHDKADNKFYRTTLATSNSPGRVALEDLFAQLQPGQTPVAVLHNHIGGPDAEFDPRFLSDPDTELGQRGYDGSNPLRMFLLANGGLREGTGERKWAAPLRKWNSAVSGKLFQLQVTAPTLAQFPIAELIKYIDNRSPIAKAAALVRKKQPANPMLAAGSQ